MTHDFLARIRQELRVTLSAAEETIVAVADRVNRKVQLLRLHWQVSQLRDSLRAVYREIGRQFTEGMPSSVPGSAARGGPAREDRLAPDADHAIVRAEAQIRTHKEQLARLESRIAAMQAEAVREDLVRFTKDLEFRGVAMQYFLVARGSPLAGRTPSELAGRFDVRVVGLIRGPLVLTPEPETSVNVGDRLLLLGSPSALAGCAQSASASRERSYAHGGDPVGRMSHP